MTNLTATGGSWDTGSGSLTIGTGTTTLSPWRPDTTYHYHWHGCGCSSVHVVAPTAHEHDYQQAQGSAYEDTLFCRTCGDTKRLKPRKAKEV